jgi:hypothetical protein
LSSKQIFCRYLQTQSAIGLEAVYGFNVELYEVAHDERMLAQKLLGRDAALMLVSQTQSGDIGEQMKSAHRTSPVAPTCWRKPGAPAVLGPNTWKRCNHRPNREHPRTHGRAGDKLFLIQSMLQSMGGQKIRSQRSEVRGRK